MDSLVSLNSNIGGDE